MHYKCADKFQAGYLEGVDILYRIEGDMLSKMSGATPDQLCYAADLEAQERLAGIIADKEFYERNGLLEDFFGMIAALYRYVV